MPHAAAPLARDRSRPLERRMAMREEIWNLPPPFFAAGMTPGFHAAGPWRLEPVARHQEETNRSLTLRGREREEEERGLGFPLSPVRESWLKSSRAVLGTFAPWLSRKRNGLDDRMVVFCARQDCWFLESSRACVPLRSVILGSGCSSSAPHPSCDPRHPASPSSCGQLTATVDLS